MFTITKQLKVNSDKVNAVEINDNGTVYPVFLEALLNQMMFDTILAEGYKYVKMPYEFFRDGKMLSELDVESRNMSDDELETMYNSIGRKLDTEYLQAHMTEEAVRALATPPTKYTIFTREEFLDYLKLVSEQALTDDVMPINYFVAPEARFTLQEYTGLGNVKWVNIITRRRTMTLIRFRRMIEKFQQIGLLSANYTPMDVVAAYMSWGMDGLNCEITDVQREFRAEILQPSTSQRRLKIRTIYGLIDANGNNIIQEDERNNPWSLVIKEQSDIERIINNLKGNETAVMAYETQTREEVLVLTIPRLTIQASVNDIKIGNTMYDTFKVVDPTNVHPNLPLELCLPNAQDKLYEYIMIEALAKDLHNSRRIEVDVSSYRALSLSGLDPRAALEYIFHNGDFTQVDFDSTDVAGGKVSASGDTLRRNEQAINEAISEYVNDTLDQEKPIYGVIASVIDGVQNIDATEFGSMLDSKSNLQGIINELTTVHNILGVSFQDMYSIIHRDRADGETSITFTGNNLSHTMMVTPLRNKIGGYSEDLHTYDNNSARDSEWMSYVIRVAREVGIPEARRHVGIEFFLVDRTASGVKKVLSHLINMFEQRVSMTITNAAQREGLISREWLFACNRYFEIALKGTITWPPQLGGMVESADIDDAKIAQNSLKRKIESLVGYCEFTVNDGGRYYKLNGFCVNAQITTSMVIPRSGCTIKEAPLYSLWYDFNQSPSTRGMYEQLVANGVFERGFVAWESRYSREQFKYRTFDKVMSDPTSLSYIYHKAEEEVSKYPADKEFLTVHHPTEYIYPGIFKAEDDFSDMETLPAPRTGTPVIRLGVTRDITLNDYKDALRPNEVIKDDTSYIKELVGIPTDVLFSVPDAMLRIPSIPTNNLLVHKGTQVIAMVDTGVVIDFHRIGEIDKEKYHITQITGNTYWFNDVMGKVWEVRI